MDLEKLLERQRQFQRLCEIDIDSTQETEVNRLSEVYLFKAIGEIIELSNTFPSEFNKFAKSPGKGLHEEILAELCDTLFFLMNFALIRKLNVTEIQNMMETVQDNNFVKLAAKKMSMLNTKIMAVPDKVMGMGGGSLSPKLIIIGQNPGRAMTEDNNCWNVVPYKSAVGFLKRALILGKDRWSFTLKDVYFTNIVKEVTDNNDPPTQEMIDFWIPYLYRELQILLSGNSPLILSMGKESTKAIMQSGVIDKTIHPITHTSYYMRRGFTEKEYYENELIPKLKMFENIEEN